MVTPMTKRPDSDTRLQPQHAMSTRMTIQMMYTAAMKPTNWLKNRA